MPLLPCRAGLESCQGWAFKPTNGHRDLILPRENPDAGTAFKEISVKHDTRPKVKEQGKTQAIEAAEINRGPQLCCSHPKATVETLGSSYRPVCLPTHRCGSMKLLPGGALEVQVWHKPHAPKHSPLHTHRCKDHLRGRARLGHRCSGSFTLQILMETCKN